MAGVKKDKKRTVLDPFQSTILTERQWACLKAKGKHLNAKRAILFIQNEYDIKIGRTTYFEELANIKKKIPELEEEFGTSGLSDRHFVRKHTFDEITEEMWVQYYEETDAAKRVSILATIMNAEQLNSIADSDTALIVEKQMRIKKIIAEKLKADEELKKLKKDGKRKDS